ncbi:MAG: AarF/UbiB family protein [Alphaproteobacteria bacterium]
MSDENSFGGRMSRYARVSSRMAGLGARMAGERYLGIKTDRDRHARELTEALGGLKGPLMKVAQMLTTIPDAIPEEYVVQLQALQSEAPPMRWLFVKRRMKSELGVDWQDRFAEFEHDATAAASLGQVHKAKLHDGRDVACKLQYPDMGSAVEADLKQLRLILSIYERADKAVRTKEIHTEIAARLREELDYAREAANMNMMRELLADVSQAHIAEVVPDLSTNRLLTMEWLQGDKILSFKEAPHEMRNQICQNMFRSWYTPFYSAGVLHGDPHLGNYTIRQDGTVNLMDFGCIRVFPAHFVGAVIELYRALQTDDEDRMVHAYETWGFSGLKREVIDVLSIWARFIYAPILSDRVQKFEETNSGDYGRETAQHVHQELRKVGGVTIPREFVFMDRAALGLGSVFLHMGAELNWHQLYEQMIDGFSVEKAEALQQSMIDKHHSGIPPA